MRDITKAYKEPQSAFSFAEGEAPESLIKSGYLNKYLILLNGNIDMNGVEMPYKWYEIIQSRQETYDYLKGFLESQNEDGISIDIFESRILVQPHTVENKKVIVNFDNMITIEKFMRDMKSDNKVIDESDFNIDDYGNFI